MLKLFRGDCLKVMKKIPNKFVSLVLADPPYGIIRCNWDMVIPLEPMWKQLNRIVKDDGAIVMTSAQPFSSMLVSSNPEMFCYEWVWVKNRVTSALNMKRMPGRNHEQIVVFSPTDKKGTGIYNPQGLKPYNKVVKIRAQAQRHYGELKEKTHFQKWTNYPRDVLYVSCENKPKHPSQKPVALMEYLIKTYTGKDGVVLDFCMGSGTTGVACKRLGRSFIGIELDRKFFLMAKKRINEA